MCALVMESTVSLHFDSFIARIGVIFPCVVAWKRARTVDTEGKARAWRELILAPFSCGYHSAIVHAVVVIVVMCLPVVSRYILELTYSVYSNV